jgi:ATP-dependent RNA helicase DeaD
MSTQQATSFAQLSLSAPILQSLQDLGYETPSPIQVESIPHLLAGSDLLGQAQTGTGKTAAFALPLLNNIDINKRHPQILVLAPTRELAIQVSEAFQTYARHLKGFHVLPIYGGQSIDTQLRHLKRGVHVVVGTPGRVMDHLRRKSLSLKNLNTIVLDEADEMLRMGFIEDVEWILEHTPEQKQIALFSATMPDVIRKVAKRYLQDPVEIKIKSKTSTVENIEQRYCQVNGRHKLDALTRILEAESFDAALIFVRTKTATAELAERLEARGYACAALNGDMNQAMRERTIDQLKKGKLEIVIATDVAARGIDVQRITHVINYDIPYDTEAYVHRIGRTGRAGRKGSAILFVAPREMRMLYSIEKATKQKIQAMQLPCEKTIANRRVEQFKQQITDTIESQELGYFSQLMEQYQQEYNFSSDEVSAALCYLLQLKRPLQYKESAPRKTERKSEPRITSREQAPKRGAWQPGASMKCYRIEVGHNQGATPKDIVGAIANEGGIGSEFIGHIKLLGDYSTVDLPGDMPKDVVQNLEKVRVLQHPINISLIGEAKPRRKKTKSKDKPEKKRKKVTLKKKKSAGKRKESA